MSHTEQMREALDRMDALLDSGTGLLAVPAGSATHTAAVADMRTIRAALTAPAAEVPEAMGEEQIVKCLVEASCIGVVKMSYDAGPYQITRPSINADKFARALIAARDAQWQSTRLRGGVPERRLIGWRTENFLWETNDPDKARNWEPNVGVLPIFEGDPNTKLTAAPQAPALDAGAVRDAAGDDMTRKWCWWLDDSESFHIADTESEAHGEAQGHIDSDCEPGHERKYSVARVQHPIDSLGIDWLARNVAEHIEDNVCCWCDDNTGAEEPSIALSKEDQNALGLMVAGFLREKASVDWWTYDKTTITEHTYVAGNNDSAPDAAMSAQAGGVA